MSSHRRMADEFSRMAAHPFAGFGHNRAGDASTPTSTSTSTSTREPASRSTSAAMWSFMGGLNAHSGGGGRWASESRSESWVNGQRHATHTRRDLNVRFLSPRPRRDRANDNVCNAGRGTCDAHVPGRDDALLCQQRRAAAAAAAPALAGAHDRPLGAARRGGPHHHQRSSLEPALEPRRVDGITQMILIHAPRPPPSLPPQWGPGPGAGIRDPRPSRVFRTCVQLA